MTRPEVDWASDVGGGVGDARGVGDRIDGDGRRGGVAAESGEWALLVEACTSKLKVETELYRLAPGVNFRPAPPCATVMKSPSLIGVVPSFWNSVPFRMLVIWKCVTSAPSAALRVMTRPLVVCVSSSVVALVTFGVSATVLTVMVAVTTLPPRPALTLLVEACTSKLPNPKKLALGVNFRPALPSAKVIKLPLIIGVVPSFWNSVPLVMLVILKCVTSVPSAALRLMTRPVVDCTSSSVVALVTLGVSAIGVDSDRRAGGAAAESCVSIAQRGLHVEAKRRRRAEQVRARREFQTGVALGKGDEVAARDRRGAVVQEQRAAHDVRDLEVRDFRAVGGVAAR